LVFKFRAETALREKRKEKREKRKEIREQRTENREQRTEKLFLLASFYNCQLRLFLTLMNSNFFYKKGVGLKNQHPFIFNLLISTKKKHQATYKVTWCFLISIDSFYQLFSNN
jgi:hypothetical protein